MSNKKLEELREIAKKEFQKLIREDVISLEFFKQLTLGTIFEGKFVIFELYQPAEKPHEAELIAYTRINTATKEAETVVCSSGGVDLE